MRATDLAQQHGVTSLPVSALLTFPTGAGKTWLAQQAAKTALARGERVLVLVPLKALARELEREWSAALPGVRVQGYSSDAAPKRVAYQKAEILIMTPERLDLITRSWRRHHGWLARLGLCVADELHLLGDVLRGARLDGALTRLRLIAPLVRVLGLTATCGNPREVARWLGGIHLHSDVRPAPLHWTVCPVRRAGDKWSALLERLTPGEGTLVFVHSRARSIELAARLREAGHQAQAHHAGLTALQRRETEDRYRWGELAVLVCTPTLSLGVNLPCQHAVLYDLTLYGAEGRSVPLSRTEAWQRAGRAGRVAGQAGRVTVLGVSREEPYRLTTPDFETLESPLKNEIHALDFVLGSIDGGLVRSAAQVSRLLSRTFAASAGHLNGPHLIARLIEQGALTEDGGRLRVTPLGRAASAALLPVADVRRATLLPDDPTALDALLLACACGPGLTLTGAADLLSETVLQRTASRLLDQGDGPFREHLQAAGVVWSACEHGDEEAAAAYNLFAPEVTGLREEALRRVRAWQAWHTLEGTSVPKLKLVQAMLAAQVGLDAATLVLLPGVGSVTAKRLAASGVDSAEALAQANPEDLPLPRAQAERLIGAAQHLVKTFDTDPTREPVPGIRSAWAVTDDVQICPLRFKRAFTLTVQAGGNGWTVSGGAQPHRVTLDSGWHCDCPDHTPRRTCKHVLAVRLFQGEPRLISLREVWQDE